MLLSSDEHQSASTLSSSSSSSWSSDHLAITVSKILAPLLLLFLTFVSGAIPILIVKRLKNKPKQPNAHSCKVIPFLECVGAGVVFATTLLHIIPEARSGFESFSNQSHNHHDHDHDEAIPDPGHVHDHRFPKTEFVVCLGFLFVYLVDELIHACLNQRGHAAVAQTYGQPPQVIQSVTNGEQTMNGTREPYLQMSMFERMENGNSGDKTQSTAPVSYGGIITVAALSFHSIFEGLFLGVQHTAAKTWLVLMAMAMHKLAIAFVIGFKQCATGDKTGAVLICVSIFSIMSPLGAVCGTLAENSFKESTLLVAVLNGIGAGTLLYVFYEILQREENRTLPGLKKFFAVTIGFCIMLCLRQFVAFISDHDEVHVVYASLNETLHDHHDLHHSHHDHVH